MIVEFNTRPVKLVHYRSSCLNFLEPNISAGIYLFKVKDGNTRTMREICSNLTMKTIEQRQ